MGLMGLPILASSFRWLAGGKWLAGGFWLVGLGIIRRQRAFDSAQTQAGLAIPPAGAGGFVGAGWGLALDEAVIIMRVLSVFMRVLSVIMYGLSVIRRVLSVRCHEFKGRSRLFPHIRRSRARNE